MVRTTANSNRLGAGETSTTDEEKAWEDVDDDHYSQRRTTRAESRERSVSTVKPSSRKRKAGKPVYKAASPRRVNSPPKNKIPSLTPSPPNPIEKLPDATPVKPIISGEELGRAMKVGIRGSLYYIVEVSAHFFYILKRPLALFLVLWVISLTLSMFSAMLRPVLAPFCFIPGISRSTWCSVVKSYDAEGIPIPLHADFPKMMEIQSKTFEQLLDDSVGSSSLALEIKKAEMATKDLVTLVKVSSLKSKEALADTLIDFTWNAKKTSTSLQKLSAKINGAVDNILAVNDYALKMIEESGSKHRSQLSYLLPFMSLPYKTSEVLTSTFSQSLAVLSSDLARLIVAGQASLQDLNNLEEQLVTIQNILTRESTTINAEKSELLAYVWTHLGGNQDQMRGFENNLRILKELGGYKKQALAHVIAALQALESLNADMEDLRERVASPELVGGEIPLQVHVKSIRSGIERLKGGRLKAVERGEEAVARLIGPGM